MRIFLIIAIIAFSKFYMEKNSCLNCKTLLSGKYCSNCGQKSDTHRISFKHFITHDVLHGTFHIERGMLYTAKQAIVRPGKAALEYIAGKRVVYYNVFYFILLLIGLNIFLKHYYEGWAVKLYGHETGPAMDKAGEKIDYFLSAYNKLIIFSFVPLTALNSYLIFKRRKLNFSEHCMISGILLLGMLILFTLKTLLSYLDFFSFFESFSEVFYVIIPFFMLGYIIFGYYDAFRIDYKLGGFILRMLIFFILCFVEFFLLFMFILLMATNWEGGEIKYVF